MSNILVMIIFYIFAAIALLSAFMVISQNNPVRCVLFLIVVFFAMSVLWLIANAEFLALILILVYVGAVMTLFLFVVMMLNIDVESMKAHFAHYLPFGLILVALLLGLLLVALPPDTFNKATVTGIQPLADKVLSTTPISNTEKIGMVLYVDYVFAFEIAAVILLVAIIAAITLVHRTAKESKKQRIAQQIMTQRDDRITLIRDM